MTEEERCLKIADLLKRRVSQREYAAYERDQIAKHQDSLDAHVRHIVETQRQLYELGYKGQ